jgi:outer membrane protein assembly factor BamB
MRARLAGVCLASALAGCSWFGPSRPAPDPLPTPSGAVSPVSVWTASLGAPSGVGFRPAFAGSSVWAAAQNGTVTRLDAGTGARVWQVDVGKPLATGIGTDGETSAVAALDGTLVSLDGQGKVKWTASVGAEIVTPPAVGQGTVIVRASDNRVIAFEADSGKRRWTFQRQNPSLVLHQASGITIAADTAYVGLPAGRLVALSLTNGAPRWDVPLALPRGTTELERISDVVGLPKVIGREICAVTYQGRLGCVDAPSGNPNWVKDFSSTSGVDVDPRGLIAIDAGDKVQAFSRGGALQWEQPKLARRSLSAPMITNRVAVTGDREGNVLWLTRSDGELAAVNKVGSKAIVAAPVFAGGLVVVQTSAGDLFAFRPE